MDFGLVLKGFISGIIVGIPFGPIGILCIRNTVRKGRIHGLCGGFGIASANAVYTLLVGFSLTVVSKMLNEYMVLFRILGGAIFCLIGFSLLLPASPGKEANSKAMGITGSYISMFIVAISNVPAILLFIAIFSALGVTGSNLDYTSGLELALGVFIGTSSWWIVLASKIDLMKSKFGVNSKMMLYIKRVIAICIAALGLGIILESFASMIAR